MTWKPELDDIAHRRKLAENLGGADKVARHRSNGKLTVRERIDGLVDPLVSRYIHHYGLYKEGPL